MDVAASLRRAREVEEVACEIYLLLAARSGPAAAAVFRRLGQEECEHANRLQMLGSMCLKDPRAFRDVKLESGVFDVIMTEMKVCHGDVERGVLDLRGAVARMVEFEGRFAMLHAEVVARNADPGVQALFGMLAAQDREHQELLRTGGVGLV